MRHTIAVKLLNMAAFSTLAFACAVLASTPAQSAVITKDYVVDASNSNISKFGSNLFVLRVYDIGSEWVKVETRDTIIGSIKFSDGINFDPEYYSQMSAQFYFSNNSYAKVAHSAWIETSLINDSGQSINYYRSYRNDASFYLGMNTDYSGLGKGKITGMGFKIKFDYVGDLNSNNPVFMQLGNISYGPFKSMVSPVPEPATWTMMLLGMTGVGLAMRRRQALTSVAHA